MSLKTVALAAAILVASAAAAFASPAVVTGGANVRAGAGVNYPIVSHVSYGQPVDVDYCTPSGKWCFVEKSGKDGWVSAQFLASGYPVSYHPHNHGVWGSQAYGYGYNAGFNACVQGQHTSFCLGF